MSFLIPQVLWALPAAAIPLIIHLISQSNMRTVEFSTLHFLHLLEHESIRRLRWHQWVVLAIRSLLLLLLVLLLARPVIKGYFRGWVGAEASTLSVVIVDDSFSMSGQPPLMSRDGAVGRWRASQQLHAIYEILSNQSGHGDALIMRATDGRIIYEGSVADIPGEDVLADLYRPSFRQDDLAAILDTLKSAPFQESAGLYANRELYIVSDFQIHQQRALREIGRDSTILNDWHLFLLPAPHQKNNVAVVRAEIETAIPLVGDLMDVSVTLRNTGSEPRSKVPIQVVLNDVRSGQLVVNLRPGEQKSVNFQVAPSQWGHQQGYAELVRDERLGDNRYYFHTFIPPVVRVLLVEPPNLEPSFTRLALRSLAENSPHIQLRVAAPDNLNWMPQEVEVLILNSLAAIPNLLRQQMRAFFEAGGTCIVIPSADPAGPAALASLEQQFGLPALGLSAQKFDASLVLDRVALKSSILREVFQREAQLDDLPGVSQLYPVAPRGTAEVVLWAAGNKPILLRSNIANGAAFQFSMPFHLMWTDMPLKGSFIPLWHRLVYWRAASPILADIRVADTPVLDIKPRQATQTITLTAPDGVRSLINPDIRTRTATLRELDRPGIYVLSTRKKMPAGLTTRDQDEIQFRVNIADEELTSGILGNSALRNLTGPSGATVLAADASIQEWIQEARFGRELWRPLLYIVLALLIAEMVLANIYHTPRHPVRTDSV